MKTEYRFSALRQHEGDRRIMGCVMRYNAVGQGPGGRPEVFAPRAFGDLRTADISLNVMHDRGRPIARTGAGLTLVDTDSMLSLTARPADTTEGKDAHTLVTSGLLRGLSIEFHALQERVENGTRIVESAKLTGIGLVDSPAHPQSLVEARRRPPETRARLGLRIKGLLAYSKVGDCGCQRGACSRVQINAGAFKDALVRDDILLVNGDYKTALSSRKRGSLILTDTPQGLAFESSIPDTSSGRDLINQVETVDLIARPYFNQEQSEYVENGNVATYSRMAMRAILITPSDAATGWDPIDLVAPPEPRRKPEQQRILTWL